MNVEKIYFDMDGVLADFERGLRELCDFEPTPQNPDLPPDYDDEMWARVRNVERFYDKLQPMPGAEDLFRTLHEKYGDKCEILTGIPRPRRGIVTAAEDKTTWVRRIFSPTWSFMPCSARRRRTTARGRAPS